MNTGGTAIVLGGGGMLGAVQVGMLRVLVEAGVRPDVVLGTSVGALNGAVLAALPPAEVADRLDELWRSPDARALFVASVYFDNATARPEWAAVKSGFFDTDVSLLPLAAAEFDGTALTVPFDSDQLKDAPHHDPGTALHPGDEADLYAHYGMVYALPAETGEGVGDGEAMTRSEERLRVGTEQAATGTARLRKYVVTEQQQVTVPVTREEVRIEREPVTEANRGEAAEGAPISGQEHEITLHEERPVVATEAVPVERVRLGTETVTEHEQVTGEVRKEEIEFDEGDTRR